ncbi:MAG: hypothetical protein WCT10_03255 [Patescibacteria group bacterium]|jgi:hypothetical protein
MRNEDRNGSQVGDGMNNDDHPLAQRLREISERPEEHYCHDVAEFNACCMVGGNFDRMLAEAHLARYGNYGRNGGTACDVIEGPCACGAWHLLDDPFGHGKIRRR